MLGHFLLSADEFALPGATPSLTQSRRFKLHTSSLLTALASGGGQVQVSCSDRVVFACQHLAIAVSAALGTFLLLSLAAAAVQHQAASLQPNSLVDRAAAELPVAGSGARLFWVAPAGCIAGILVVAALGLEFNRRCGGAEKLGVPQPEVLIVSGSLHPRLDGEYYRQEDGTSPGGLACQRWKTADGAHIKQSSVRISIFGSKQRALRKSGGDRRRPFAMTMRAARGRWPHQFRVIPMCRADFDNKDERMDWDLDMVISAGDDSPTSQHSGGRGYAQGICLVLALAGFIPCSMLLMRTYDGGLAKRTFAVPVDVSLSAMARTCHCVVVDGDVVMPPVALSWLAVAFSFAVNASVQFWMNRVWRTHQRPINELMWESVRTPSWHFLIYSIAVQIVYVWALVGRCHSAANSLRDLAEKVMVNIMNSSVLVLFVTATAGQILTLVNEDETKTGYSRSEPYAHLSLPAGLRQWIGYGLFVMLLPGLALVGVAAVIWFWISMFSSTFFSMMIEVFLPEASDAILQQRAIIYMALTRPESIGERHSFSGRLEKVVKLGTNIAMFPAQNVVAYVSARLGLWQRRTMVGPAMRTLLVGVLCVYKSLELQMFYDIGYFYTHSVSYLDSVPLAFQARQNYCSMCLSVMAVEDAWNVVNKTSSFVMNETSTISDEAIAKFWSSFT